MERGVEGSRQRESETQGSLGGLHWDCTLSASKVPDHALPIGFNPNYPPWFTSRHMGLCTSSRTLTIPHVQDELKSQLKSTRAGSHPLAPATRTPSKRPSRTPTAYLHLSLAPARRTLEEQWPSCDPFAEDSLVRASLCPSATPKSLLPGSVLGLISELIWGRDCQFY